MSKNLTSSSIFLMVFIVLFGCSQNITKHQEKQAHMQQKKQIPIPSTEQLLRDQYVSTIDQKERDYFVYLPRGYETNKDKKWPVMLFLHGNGERGDGKDDLEYVITHGPLHEAWVQKKDLPFIIISPQLHMFGFDKMGLDYIDNRSKVNIPKRLKNGVPQRSAPFETNGEMIRVPALTDMSEVDPLLPQGWDKVETDLVSILHSVQNKYRVNTQRTYLTGLSYGGFGTWYLASKYPEKFAAIAPVVGWGHPSLMAPIAKHKLPVWVFAGGRDSAVDIKHFYAGVNKLEALGHNNVRFSVHEDKGHDTWTRVYAGDDLYNWLLEYKLDK